MTEITVGIFAPEKRCDAWAWKAVAPMSEDDHHERELERGKTNGRLGPQDLRAAEKLHTKGIPGGRGNCNGPSSHRSHESSDRRLDARDENVRSSRRGRNGARAVTLNVRRQSLAPAASFCARRPRAHRG